ncbi:hypothetical protein [Paludibaculum fermentans]|uniref:Uncharacterized protein n=1 Tax=Paludibaculum fermentans TaxID=1473598 RepID=A0A7S7NKC2_PALFE|nr:hypothetical protein [Paludibaculum fermentans]QOY85182.1 hypothetical protein IRI77_20310 [Paludibaculum fermentans]
MNDNEALRAPGHCLEPAEIEAFVEGRADQLAAHVEACPACSHVAASYREFLEADVRADEKADIEWIESRLRKPAPKRSWFAWLGPSPMPRWAFSLAAILLIVAGSLQLRRMAGPGLRTPETGASVVRSSQVHLQSPSGDVETAPDFFQWDPVDKAAAYEFQITEVDGTPLWTGRTNQTKLNSAPDIQRFMLPRKALLWRVKALSASGGVIAESASERFKVLPSASR